MLLVACFTQPAAAQFEGQITYESYNYSEQQTEEQQDEFTLTITPDRMMLSGNNSYNFMESIDTEGLLVRLDNEDFVFMTGKNQALKISKSDITSLMNMFDNGESPSDVAEEVDEINYKKTGETTDILGYKCEKFIFRDEDNEDEYAIVWMTKEINVNWGMLADPWSGSAEDIVSNFPTNLVFKEKYFPVRVESYEDGQLDSKLEAKTISEKEISSRMVEVPSGISVMTFQEYLFNQMEN
ncbi:GLPGLI family protein [Fodinibius salinus]|uniref:GLPGLI family protein n=2 Tax=Fodinibius salinus TaxID=860790 RepID=A0A5D3YGX7_9BACT|nr:GLPGLI family protein [Fodinibius salinus]